MSILVRFTSIVLVLASINAACPAELNPTDDFKYVSDETKLLIAIRMPQLLNSSVFKQFHKAHPALSLEFRGEYGVEMSNVRLLVMAETLSSVMGSMSIVHLKKPVTGEAVAAVRSKGDPRFSNDMALRYVKEEFRGFTIHVPKPDDRVAFCLVDGLTIVNARVAVGSAVEQLKRVLPLKSPPKHADLLRKEWRAADPAATVTVFVGYGAIVGGCKAPLIRAEIQKHTGVDLYELLHQGPGVLLTVKFGPQVSLRATIGCRDDNGTKVVKEQCETFRAFGVKKLKGMPLPAEVIAAPEKVQITVKGKVVAASLTVSDKSVIALLNTWFPAKK
jgi:hypothetical protein